ncbi:hypothetical protein KKB18_12650, partial [bacterium]|nr:hypothetical protein [bacterium]
MKKIKECSIAFLSALLLWSLATSQNLSESSFIVDLKITNIPKDYIISKKSDIKLSIAVAGPKSMISKLDSFAFNAIYKMPENVKSGEFSFRISPTDIYGPSGVDVKSVSPSFIRISLDKAATKLVNIRAEIVGNPAEGYNVTKVELIPSQVNISGPEEMMSQITEVKTETPFDVTGLDGPYRQKVRLLLDDKSFSFVDIQFTTVNIDIEPIIITKRLENIAITTYPVDIKTKLIPEKFTAD